MRNLSYWSKIILMISVLLGFSTTAKAQRDKRDYVWINGYDFTSEYQGNDNFIFNFNNGSSPKLTTGLPLSFSGNNTSICDKDGNLLLYSNGCHIADANNNIIENGSGINEGIWVDTIKDTCDDYPGFQDVLLLDSPSSNEFFYLIHKRTNRNPNDNRDFYRTLNYSTINIESDSDKPIVVEKNSILFDSERFLYSYLTAIPHQNGKDWWITQPLELSPELAVIKLDENGFEITGTYTFPFEYVDNSSASGSARFSPDGTKYAYFNTYDNLVIYDFDRETGEMSNQQYIELFDTPDEDIRGGSVEWSPNSRFIYLSAQDVLVQLDTWDSDLKASAIEIDTYDGGLDPFPTQFFMMALAPDCRIYMNSLNGSQSYHVINKPNEKGLACDFVQQGIKLPAASSVGTMPNFPRFRVDEENKCDPTITSIFGDDIYWRRDLTCYPIPVMDELTVELPEQKRGQIVVVDMGGQVVIHKELIAGTPIKQLSMGGLPAGTYSVEFIPDNNKERRIWTKRVVKID